jgi:uncharacterized membrane protein
MFHRAIGEARRDRFSGRRRARTSPRLEVLEGRALLAIFTTIDVPISGSMAQNIRATGINNAGSVVGTFTQEFPIFPPSTAGSSSNQPSVIGFGSFVLSAGSGLTRFMHGVDSTSTFGINDAGSLVGTYSDPTSATPAIQGFVRLAGGTYIPIDAPGAESTFPNGINNYGVIVGYYDYSTNTGFGESGFVLSANLQTFQTINVPGAVPGTTQAFGINNLGQIVGSYTATTGGVHGFVLSGDLQTYQTFDVAATIPGAQAGTTEAYGINDAGQVVGSYTDIAGSHHGFVLSFDPTGAVVAYETINAPNGFGTTSASGINNAGWVVGAYETASGSHGFEMTGTPVLTPITVPSSTPTPTPTPTAAQPLVTMTGVRAVTNQKQQVTRVVVTFSGALDPAEADSLADYYLAMPRNHSPLTAGNARTIRLKSARYHAASNTVTLVPKTPFKLTKPVEVLVVGMPPSGLRDSQGQFIDGDDDGQPGGNAVAILSVTSARTAAVSYGPSLVPVSVRGGVRPGVLPDGSSHAPNATDPAQIGALVDLDVPDALGEPRRARRHAS